MSALAASHDLGAPRGTLSVVLPWWRQERRAGAVKSYYPRAGGPCRGFKGPKLRITNNLPRSLDLDTRHTRSRGFTPRPARRERATAARRTHSTLSKHHTHTSRVDTNTQEAPHVAREAVRFLSDSLSPKHRAPDAPSQGAREVPSRDCSSAMGTTVCKPPHALLTLSLPLISKCPWGVCILPTNSPGFGSDCDVTQ